MFWFLVFLTIEFLIALRANLEFRQWILLPILFLASFIGGYILALLATEPLLFQDVAALVWKLKWLATYFAAIMVGRRGVGKLGFSLLLPPSDFTTSPATKSLCAQDGTGGIGKFKRLATGFTMSMYRFLGIAGLSNFLAMACANGNALAFLAAILLGAQDEGTPIGKFKGLATDDAMSIGWFHANNLHSKRSRPAGRRGCCLDSIHLNLWAL